MIENPIPVLALVVSAISLTVSLLNYLRDKPNARVVIFKTALIGGTGGTEPYMSVSVTNTGRRPLTISTVGYRTLWKPRASIVITTGKLPKKLAEAEDVLCLFKKTDVLHNGSWKKVAYVFASDNAGKEYRRNIAPFYKVLVFKLLGKIANPLRRAANILKHREDD